MIELGLIELDPEQLTNIYPDDVCLLSDILTLEESIKEQGQMTPVNVLAANSQYFHVGGNKRIIVCRKLGIKVKCIVHTNSANATN